MGYLYSLVPLCLLRFSRYLSPGDKTPWFEYRNLPLKWCVGKERGGRGGEGEG